MSPCFGAIFNLPCHNGSARQRQPRPLRAVLPLLGATLLLCPGTFLRAQAPPTTVPPNVPPPQPPAADPAALVPLAANLRADPSAVMPEPTARLSRLPLLVNLLLASVPALPTVDTAAAAPSASAALPTLRALVLDAASGLVESVQLGQGQTTAAQVTLLFALTHAGKKVLVHPLDGGTLNGKAGAQFLTLGLDGSLPLAFACSGRPGNYSVLVRLEGTETALSFVLPPGPPQDHSIPAAQAAVH